MEKYLIVLTGLLLVSIVFSVMQITKASPAAPNPGHAWDQIECDTNLCVDTENGRVGIGITEPTTNLDVNGTVNATSFVGLGVVPIGSIIAHHLTDVPGADNLDAVRAAGFATCDGTTPEAQGITDAVITEATPDLNSDVGGNEDGGRFLRGGSISGTEQSDEFKSHKHAHMYQYFLGTGGSYRGWTEGGSWDPRISISQYTKSTGGTETRPVNMSVVWIMRVK